MSAFEVRNVVIIVLERDQRTRVDAGTGARGAAGHRLSVLSFTGASLFTLISAGLETVVGSVGTSSCTNLDAIQSTAVPQQGS